jgi:hypothetical protein
MPRRTRWIALLVSLVLLLPRMGTALAQAPTNDDQADAVSITSLPFTASESTAEATADGPRFCGNDSSVFWKFRPDADVTVQVDTFGSDYDTELTVFTISNGAADRVKCNDDFFSLQSALKFTAHADTRYFIMAHTCCGSGRDHHGGNLTITVDVAPTSAPTATLTVDRPGTLTARHHAILTGTVTCDERGMLFARIKLRQLHDEILLSSGRTFLEVPCDATVQAWSAEVHSRTGVLFSSGKAIARIRWEVGNTAGRAAGHLRARVRLASTA